MNTRLPAGKKSREGIGTEMQAGEAEAEKRT
jgi:hypothetical protein